MGLIFSLVIPAWNEERLLPRLLDTVDVARERFDRGAEAVEVIVADNQSTDATAEIAREEGCRVVSVEKRVIGAVRNGGARVARGEILAFVDADARIHPETFNVIEETLSDQRIVGGATGVRLERWSFGIAVTFALLAPLVWATGMDTGVVFCRRGDFGDVGGYDEERLFAEDVQFLWDLRRLGRRRGRALARATAAKAIASTRKFDRHGEWHYLRNLGRSAYWMVRSRPEELERWAVDYWYRDPR